MTRLKLMVRNFQAIQKADITLDGITVVTGDNGCGKSTLSRLLYHTFQMPDHLEGWLVKEFFRKIRPVSLLFDRVAFFNGVAYRQFRSSESLQELKISVFVFLKYFAKEILPQNKQYRSYLKETWQRLFSKDPGKKTSARMLKDIAEEIHKLYEEYTEKLQKNDIAYLHRALRNVLHEEVKGKFDILENEKLHLVENPEERFIPSWIQKTLYIDTPIIVGEREIENSHWKHLFQVMAHSAYNEENLDSLNPLLSKLEENVGGKILFEKEAFIPQFFFQPTGTKERYELTQCATGIRSLAILYRLLANGYFQDDVLMIVDEPEVHLHPQWVVEYARMVVLIHKYCKTCFFLASHHPDMISALQRIAKKEGVDIHFYLAEKARGKKQYTYHHQGNNIEKIFTSFNIALERIEEYGNDEEENDEDDS